MRNGVKGLSQIGATTHTADQLLFSNPWKKVPQYAHRAVTVFWRSAFLVGRTVLVNVYRLMDQRLTWDFVGRLAEDGRPYDDFEAPDPHTTQHLLDMLSGLDEARPCNAIPWAEGFLLGDDAMMVAAEGKDEANPAPRPSTMDYLEATGLTPALVDSLHGKGPLRTALEYVIEKKPALRAMSDRPEATSIPKVSQMMAISWAWADLS